MSNFQLSAPPAISRTRLLKTALFLTWLTLGWMTIEGVASLWLGAVSNSLLLDAFGIDSGIELVSAAVLLWRLNVEFKRRVSEEQIEGVERKAAKIVGYTLYGLALYVLASSAYGILLHPRITNTNESAWGILIGLVAKVGMPALAAWKIKVADGLNSRALRADAMEAITCGYLSIVLMIGLVAIRLLGWWWLDSVAALALIPFIVREAKAAVEGKSCCESCTT